MKKELIGKNSPYRLFNKGNMCYDAGATHIGFPGMDVLEYTGWKDEQMSWKENCYIGDWTGALDDLTIEGPDAVKFLSSITVNTFENFAIHQAKHFVQCTEDGKVAAEGIMFRWAEDKFVIQNNVSWTYYLWQKRKDDYNIKLTLATPKVYKGVEVYEDTFKFQVSGPKALYLAEKVTGMNLRNVKFMHFIPVQIAGRDCIAIRQGMAGEIGFEFQGLLKYGAEIYEYIFKAGEEFGCRRLGTRTGMINHLEACFPTWTAHYQSATLCDEGYLEYMKHNCDGFFLFYPMVKGSFDGTIEELTFNPYEMGWGNRVKFDHDFLGREALEKISRNVRRNVVTLEYNAEDILDIVASHFQTKETPYDFLEIPQPPVIGQLASKVLNKEGKLIGISSNPGYSYYFRKVLALTFLDVEYCTLGTEVQILWGEPDGRQKIIKATVAPAPYKTDSRKVDLQSIRQS